MHDRQRGYTRDLKLRLRILIASAYPKKPGVSLANLLEEGHCPIELTHNSFDPIKAILLGLFPQLGTACRIFRQEETAWAEPSKC